MSELTAEQWARVESLFEQALQQPEAERESWLEDNCTDVIVRAEVHSLLQVRPKAKDFLDQPAVSDVPRSASREDHKPRTRIGPLHAEMTGQSLGHYTIVRQIASGGMGTVYEAQQDQPRRTVALKVINPGVVSKDLIRRFEQEAEVLGKLQHPGIAQIHDAGMFDLGAGAQPYFAMEFIRGTTLTEYATLNKLGTRERLKLFLQVCTAVQHAHHRGVIHRDLKPGNILVNELGHPKILDFGVARATDADIQTATLRTDIGQLIGTVPYMSPEQATGRPDDVDTRSDVYALGVVLYELLAGRLPYSVKDKMIHEAVRVIREDEPTPLSTINPAFRGDVETILLKALEKEKVRRYQTPSELDADINRYLADEPIAARPPSALYQLGKFAKRNRGLVSTIAAVLVMLIIGIVVTSFMALEQTRLRGVAEDRRIEAEHDRDRARDAEEAAEERRLEAERQTRIARAVNEFLNNDLLSAADPWIITDRSISMREVLDRAAERIADRFPDEPKVEAVVRTTLGRTYSNLGEYDQAKPHLERALELHRLHGDESSLEALEAKTALANVFDDTGAFDRAESMLTSVVDEYSNRLGDLDERTLGARVSLAEVLGNQNRLDEAEALLVPTYESIREAGLVDQSIGRSALNNLAFLMNLRGRFEEAEPLFVELVAMKSREAGRDHPDTLTTINNLALLYFNVGRYPDAEPLFREIYENSQRVLGETHIKTLTCLGNLALTCSALGQSEEAEELYRRTIDLHRTQFDEDHAGVLGNRHNYANLLTKLGRLEEAEDILIDVLERRRRALGNANRETQETMNILGRLYYQQQRFDEAEPLIQEALGYARQELGPAHPNTLAFMNTLGSMYSAQGRFEEAVEVLSEVLETLKANMPPGFIGIGVVSFGLGNALVKLERYAEAVAAFTQAHEVILTSFGPEHARTRMAIEALAGAYEALGDAESAATWRSKLN